MSLLTAGRTLGLLLFLCFSSVLSAQTIGYTAAVRGHIWDEEWTTIKYFRSGGRQFVFLAMENGTNTAGKNSQIRTLTGEGDFGEIVYSKGWTDGWTSTEFYTIGRQTYMMRLKERGNGSSGYNVHIDRVNANGTIGRRVKSYGWSQGWSTVKVFKVNGRNYLFLLKKNGTGRSGKNAHIHPFNADGTIGKRIYERKWSEGWTNVEFYRKGASTYFVRMKARGYGDSGNNVHVNRVNSDGTIGRRVDSYRWTEGWTQLKSFQLGGITYLVTLKQNGRGESGDNLHMYHVKPDGSVGRIIQSSYIGQGYKILELFDVGGRQRMLWHKKRTVSRSGSYSIVYKIYPVPRR